MAFRVHDDFIDDEEEPDGRVFLNDGVELFFDGDRVPNDFSIVPGPKRGASREGFQLLSDSLGRQMTVADDFTNNDWKAATTRLPDGYIVEFEVPLSLIDTSDGSEYAPATTGSFIGFNAAVNDNDSAIHAREDYGTLWMVGPPDLVSCPAIRGETSWRVGLSLSGPREELNVAAPGDRPNGGVARAVAGNAGPSLQRVARYDHGPGQTVLRGGPRE